MKNKWKSDRQKQVSIEAMKAGLKKYWQSKEAIYFDKLSGVDATKKKLKQKISRFRKFKKDYKDKIIDCPESPSGKAYIGISKRPLMTNTGYHGFQGVLLQDDDRKFVQCAACGKWMSFINKAHLKSCCGLTPKEYKAKFGLMISQGLVSDDLSFQMTKNALKNKSTNSRKQWRRILNKPQGNTAGKISSVQEENKFGVCREQLRKRLYEFIICNREMPGCRNRGSSLYKALYRRFGGLNVALGFYGLPEMKRVGTTYEFKFKNGEVKMFNINKLMERELLFRMLVEKCKELKKQYNYEETKKEDLLYEEPSEDAVKQGAFQYNIEDLI